VRRGGALLVVQAREGTWESGRHARNVASPADNAGPGHFWHHGSTTSGGGFILAGIVGYLGPSAFGLGAAELIRAGHPVAVLWIAVAALALLAVLARRSAFGIAVALACPAGCGPGCG